MNSKDTDMKNDTDSLIWKRIKEVAENKGITMASLSTSLGKSINYMNTMYYGNAKIPCSLLISIAKILQVPAEYLLSGNSTSVFEDEMRLRKMVMVVASDENLMTQSELRVIYSIMLDMIGHHMNAEKALKMIKIEERDHTNPFFDPDYKDFCEPLTTISTPITIKGDKSRSKPKT